MTTHAKLPRFPSSTHCLTCHSATHSRTTFSWINVPMHILACQLKSHRTWWCWCWDQIHYGTIINNWNSNIHVINSPMRTINQIEPRRTLPLPRSAWRWQVTQGREFPRCFKGVSTKETAGHRSNTTSRRLNNYWECDLKRRNRRWEIEECH